MRETCAAKLLPSGEVVQIQSSVRTSSSCASNDRYEEMRAGNDAARFTDIKSNRFTQADAVERRNQDRRDAFYARAQKISADYEPRIQEFKVQLDDDLQTIRNGSDDDKHPVFQRLCHGLNHAECAERVRNQSEAHVRELQQKKMAALKALPRPEFSKPQAADQEHILIPKQVAFFDRTGETGSDSLVKSLPIRRPISVSNLSPLADIPLVARCCADSYCEQDIAKSRPANQLTPNKIAPQGPAGAVR